MTLDEARLMAGVNKRAGRLFEDGYQAVWIEEGYTLDVTNDEGTTYTVDVLFETCTCPFWTRWQGRHACKHLLGWERLLEKQAEQQAAIVLCHLTGPDPHTEPVQEPALPAAPQEVAP